MVNSHHYDQNNPPEPLTEREQEILSCLVEGLSNREIANRLHLAYRTVRWYNSQIYSKLGVNNREDAVERAQVLGLLETTTDRPPDFQARHNLPQPTTPFIGRQRELADLAALLAQPEARLLTILAPGGMGKTRLALAVAEGQLAKYRNGVFFVPLAPLTVASDMVTTIAEAIGFEFHGETPPTKQLVDYLKDRSVLLVLDNFEHLLGGASLVADILRDTSNTRMLATSRERLNLSGETVYSLSGLDFPTWETPEDALEYDAVQLFMQSAARARADFVLLPGELAYLARICRLTGGMPLGIELAAGWVDLLSLEKIAVEIQRGLDILETEHRDVPERHRSVLATFNYTWERLEPALQDIFIKLSVFRGGFTLEAAEAVAGANLRHLRKLANKSLIQPLPNNRYEVHELLRQYGMGKLKASGELAVIQAKHIAFFADFLYQRTPDIKGRRQIEGLNEIEADFDNIRYAWENAIQQSNCKLLDHMVEGLILFCEMRSRVQEGITLLGSALALEPTQANRPDFIRWNRLRARHAEICLRLETPEAAGQVRADIERSLAYAKEQQDTSTAILCAWLLGESMQYQIDERTQSVVSTGSLPILQRALAYEFSDSDLYYRNRILLSLVRTGITSQTSWQKIAPFFREHAELSHQLGDQWAMAMVFAQGSLRFVQEGNWEANIDSWRQAREIGKRLGDKSHLVGGPTSYLALFTFESGNFPKANQLAEEAYQIAYDINQIHAAGRASIVMTAINLITADSVSAIWLERLNSVVNQGAAAYWVPYAEWLFALVAWHAGDVESASNHLHTSLEVFKRLYRVPEAIMCLPIIAFILSKNGQHERAVELLGRAMSEPPLKSGWMEKWSRLTQLRDELKRELGDTAYQTAWERGKTLDMETVINELLELFSDT